jgi:hypothetical protein
VPSWYGIGNRETSTCCYGAHLDPNSMTVVGKWRGGGRGGRRQAPWHLGDQLAKRFLMKIVSCGLYERRDEAICGQNGT